jgi:hypothetical protein
MAMTGDEQLAIFTAGVQTRFEVPAHPTPVPEVIQEIMSRTERRRAQDAWNAACRLRLLIELWCNFLVLGVLRARLDDATEDAIARCFPELHSLGGVLNMLAQGMEWGEDVAQALPAFDQAHQMKRAPADRHQNDTSRDFGTRTIQGLIAEFRRLMATNAECLHLLEVRKEVFQRPWKVLQADLAKLTCIDADFTGDRPHLDFVKALKSTDFQEVRGRLMRELQELVEQFKTYPEAVLHRPEVASAGKGGPAKSAQGLSLEVANEKVRAYLLRHHDARSREIAQAIGCSEGQVRRTPSWRAVSKRRQGGKSGGKKIGFEIAEERKAEETWKAQEEAEADREKEPDDKGQQLAELIEEQTQEQRADQRQSRRRKR